MSLPNIIVKDQFISQDKPVILRKKSFVQNRDLQNTPFMNKMLKKKYISGNIKLKTRKL